MSINDTASRPFCKTLNTATVFISLWLLIFALYFPAAKAGFVTDFTGWLEQVKNHSFLEFINRTHFEAHSLYQFTQLATWFFYNIIGINPWLWHLLFITLHVVNATLIFNLLSRLLSDIDVQNNKIIAFVGVVLFTISPYLSEVVVWEPSYHFLQGLLFISLILLSAQSFINTGKQKYAFYACSIYFISTFTLEAFYLTPWMVLCLALFYHHSKAGKIGIMKNVMFQFFLPMMALFVIRLIIYKLAYGGWVSRIGSTPINDIKLETFGKPAKYLYHLLLMGRFKTFEDRHKAYALCDSLRGILIFYGLVVSIMAVILVRFKQMGGKGKVASLLFVWMMISFLLLIPLWFSDMLLVNFDRYTYFTAPFFYTLLSVLAAYISIDFIRLVVLGLYAMVNLRYTILVSRYWWKSEKIIHNLLVNIPDPGNKTILLLNLPECMNGVPMIGSQKQSEFKGMHNLLLPEKPIKNTTYDVLSYNMLTPADGAHVTVLNDSTVRITLNQWGTWWWYEGKGAYSYETSVFKENLVDGGHFYDLILRQPPANYLLLYQVGNQWKVVDWNKKGVDQN